MRKSSSHIPPPSSFFVKENIKRKNKNGEIIETSPFPHDPHIIKKQQHCGCRERRRGGRQPSADETRRREVAVSQEWWRWWGGLTAWSLHLCVTGGRAKGWRGREGAGRWRGEGRGGRGGGRGGGEEEGGWPFLLFFNPEQRHSLCILSSFESTYTICSCRLVDILVYVHSSGREHMQRVS